MDVESMFNLIDGSDVVTVGTKVAVSSQTEIRNGLVIVRSNIGGLGDGANNAFEASDMLVYWFGRRGT